MDATLSLFPLSTVLMPGVTLRLHIFEDRYKHMVGQCIAGRAPFGVVLDRNGQEAGDVDPVEVGTTAEIREVTHLPQGRLFIVTRGVRRFETQRVIGKTPFWTALVSYLDEPVGPSDAAHSLRETALERFKDYLQALLSVPGKDLEPLQLPEDPVAASYIVADALQVETAAKQRLLESESAAQRLHEELKLLDDEIRRIRATHSAQRSAIRRMRAPFSARFSLN
ncbi:MAG: LON peptidase substrate-binding domain-containing protein [Candidatus Eremiobacteraeota bacterium]|nr:LON peptidase substrate-binding domain-containing protein [Candidatus Eremiobacteraeota bacterium]